jgi:hypothetical protein
MERENDKQYVPLYIEYYMPNIDNCENVAFHRNKLLNILHGKIPSYALWDAESISQEKLSERVSWYEEIIPQLRAKTNELFYSPIINKWIDRRMQYYSPISQRFIGPSADNG